MKYDGSFWDGNKYNPKCKLKEGLYFFSHFLLWIYKNPYYEKNNKIGEPKYIIEHHLRKLKFECNNIPKSFVYIGKF